MLDVECVLVQRGDEVHVLPAVLTVVAASFALFQAFVVKVAVFVVVLRGVWFFSSSFEFETLLRS